jgi:peptide deformylase
MELKNHRLRLKTKPVDFKYQLKLQILEQEMLKIMLKHGGIGLAANQIGLLESVFIIKLESDTEHTAYWNPKITEFHGETIPYSEGCLSYPNKFCEIYRSSIIDIEYYNNKGELQSQRLDGLRARVAQHEYDHLIGKTMYDRLEEQELKNAK